MEELAIRLLLAIAGDVDGVGLAGQVVVAQPAQRLLDKCQTVAPCQSVQWQLPRHLQLVAAAVRQLH